MVYKIFISSILNSNDEYGIGIAVYDETTLKAKILKKYKNKTKSTINLLSLVQVINYLIKNKITGSNVFVESNSLYEQLEGKRKFEEHELAPLFIKIKKLSKKLNIQFNFINKLNNTIANKFAKDNFQNITTTSQNTSNSSNTKNIQNNNNFSQTNTNQIQIQKQSQIQKQPNRQNQMIRMNQVLKLDKTFFGKINCLKIQMNNNNEVYFHMGLLNKIKNIWVWEKVKMSEGEIGEIIHLLNKEIGKCAFFHRFQNKTTQIWCNKTSISFGIKIQAVSKNFRVGEFEVLRIILEESIKVKNFRV